MTQIAAQGMTMTLPLGWEARIARRAVTRAHERAFSVMHCASFPLPEQRDDFGGNFIETMRSADVFVTLFEYGPESVYQPLFASTGVPRVDAQMFSSTRLQRRRPGQLGCQLFFNAGGRAFCLYVVAGSRAALPAIVSQVNHALDALHIGAGP
jgi:hypothetical protein